MNLIRHEIDGRNVLEAKDLAVIDEDNPWRPPDPDVALLGLKNMWANEFHAAKAKLDEALADMATWRLKAHELQRTIDLMHRVLAGDHSIFDG